MDEVKEPQKDIFDKVVALGKKILRFGLWGIVALIGLSILISGGVYGYEYLTKTRHINNVTVTMSVATDDECPDDFPIKIFVGNGSRKTINKITIYPEARREGYSDDLAGIASVESDKIIPPNEGYSTCWRGELSYEYEKRYKPADLIWTPETYYIEFE